MKGLPLVIILIGLLATGCGSAPTPPAWQASAYGAMQGAVEAYLTGHTAIADAEMARARAEVSRTGRPALLARLELVLCAARVASLDFDGCPAYQAWAADAEAPERAYAAYLYGRPQASEIALLPEQHRAVAAMAMAASGAPAALPLLQDPLAQLIAAGVLLQAGRLDPQSMVRAGDTASAQGWRRPLWAWLILQARRAEDAGDREATLRIRRRIELLGKDRK